MCCAPPASTTSCRFRAFTWCSRPARSSGWRGRSSASSRALALLLAGQEDRRRHGDARRHRLLRLLRLGRRDRALPHHDAGDVRRRAGGPTGARACATWPSPPSWCWPASRRRCSARVSRCRSAPSRRSRPSCRRCNGAADRGRGPQAAWNGLRCAVGHAAGLVTHDAGRQHRDRAVRGLPFPDPQPLRPRRQCAGAAARLAGRDAVGGARRSRLSVRARRSGLANDGAAVSQVLDVSAWVGGFAGSTRGDPGSRHGRVGAVQPRAPAGVDAGVVAAMACARAGHPGPRLRGVARPLRYLRRPGRAGRCDPERGRASRLRRQDLGFRRRAMAPGRRRSRARPPLPCRPSRAKDGARCDPEGCVVETSRPAQHRLRAEILSLRGGLPPRRDRHHSSLKAPSTLRRPARPRPRGAGGARGDDHPPGGCRRHRNPLGPQGRRDVAAHRSLSQPPAPERRSHPGGAREHATTRRPGTIDLPDERTRSERERAPDDLSSGEPD